MKAQVCDAASHVRPAHRITEHSAVYAPAWYAGYGQHRPRCSVLQCHSELLTPECPSDQADHESCYCHWHAGQKLQASPVWSAATKADSALLSTATISKLQPADAVVAAGLMGALLLEHHVKLAAGKHKC